MKKLYACRNLTMHTNFKLIGHAPDYFNLVHGLLAIVWQQNAPFR